MPSIPSFISNPINLAKATQPKTGRWDTIPQPLLDRMADLFTNAYSYAVQNRMKTSPQLEGMAELLQGSQAQLQKRTLSKPEEALKAVGGDVPMFNEPQDVTEDEAKQWIAARTSSFASPKDYAAQLRGELDSFQGMPKLYKTAQAALTELETQDPDELDELMTAYSWKVK